MHGPKEKEILPTCARSPSYLYSQVKRLPSNLSSTSPIAFVGFANIGLRGTPGVNLHFSRSLSMPTSRIAGTTRSYVGSSLAKYYDQVGRVKNSLIVVPIYRLDNLSSLLQPGSELLFVQTFIRWLAISYWSVHDTCFYSPCSCSARTAACAKATKTVRSALPIRSFPSRLRTMYFASAPWHAARSFVMIETFLFCD